MKLMRESRKEWQKIITVLFAIMLFSFFFLEHTSPTGMASGEGIYCPGWLLYAGMAVLMLLIIILIAYFLLPEKRDIELIPQPGQILRVDPLKEQEAQVPEASTITKLRAYVNLQLSRGSSIASIERFLAAAGWPKEILEKEMQRARRQYSNMINS